MLCGLCPRNCRADRETKPGVCGMPWEPVVARAMLHQWEEPCLVGEKGAGAVFFSGCNLRCVYCQNRPISQGGVGKTVSVSRLREIFRSLIDKGLGIEVNTNRGGTPLPDGKWLRLYRELGGELVTLGTDAHSADFVGCAIRERQALLRECGFARFCTFAGQKPVWHEL